LLYLQFLKLLGKVCAYFCTYANVNIILPDATAFIVGLKVALSEELFDLLYIVTILDACLEKLLAINDCGILITIRHRDYWSN